MNADKISTHNEGLPRSDTRPTGPRRGYESRWRRFRIWILGGISKDEECLSQSRVTFCVVAERGPVQVIFRPCPGS